MKKFIAFMILVFITITMSYALDTKAIDSTVKTSIATVDTSSTFKMIYSDIKDGISGIASALKVGAEHVYEVLVKQQRVDAIIYLTIDMFLLLLAIICIWIGFIFDKRRGDVAEFIATSCFVVGVIMFVLLIIVVIINTSPIITGFINPEYGAIKEIINWVR